MAGMAVRGRLHPVRPHAEEGVAIQHGALAVRARAEPAQEPKAAVDHPAHRHAAGASQAQCQHIENRSREFVRSSDAFLHLHLPCCLPSTLPELMKYASSRNVYVYLVTVILGYVWGDRCQTSIASLPSLYLKAYEESDCWGSEIVKWAGNSFIIAQIIESLKACHATGIVHRDVKPQNVIISTPEMRTKLIDLGAAADLRIGINYVPNEFLLDPRYAPPEQYIMSTQVCVLPH